MQAIIFANRLMSELAPLNSQYCAALLPVANKALIEYTLEDLSRAGITRAKLIVSEQTEAIQQVIGNGEKWDVNIEYFLSKPEEDVDSVINRLHLSPEESLLVVRGDILRSPCIKRFVEFAAQVKNTFVLAAMNNQNPGLLMLPAGKEFSANLNWPLKDVPKPNVKFINHVLHGMAFHLDNFQNYFAANEYVIHRADEFTLNGRQLNCTFDSLGIRIAPQSSHPDFSGQHVYGAIGSHSFIDQESHCKGSIVIGNNCIIEKGDITNSIILPNTYVGENLSVDKKIISQNIIIDVAKNSWLQIDDANLVAKNEPIASNETSTVNTVSLGQRILGFLLMIVSFPLMLISMIVALTHSKPALKTIKPQNNHFKNITLYEIGVKSNVLSKLPQLWNVVKGELQLFGASTKTHQQISYGVFGPVQLWLDDNAPQEEIEMVELEFQHLNQFEYFKRLCLLS